MLGNLLLLLLSSADFFQNYNFLKNSFRNTECQRVLILIRTDVLSAPIWVQTVCNGNQEKTNVSASKEKVTACISKEKGQVNLGKGQVILKKGLGK